MELSDADIIQAIRAGEETAFRILVERHSRRLFQLAYRMTGNAHDAEDLVQTILLRVHRYLDRFNADSQFSTWMHRIAVNCCLDHLRSNQKHREQLKGFTSEQLDQMPGGGRDPYRSARNSDDHRRVVCALAELTPLERVAFVSRHFEQDSIKDISQALEVSEQSAKQSIFRAVKKVRAALQREEVAL